MADTDTAGGAGGKKPRPTWTWKQYEYQKPGELTAYQKHARSRSASQQQQLQRWGEEWTPEKSYWDNPVKVARYHQALKALPPETEPPPWLNREEIDLAYEYMNRANNGAPWWQWKYLNREDPGLQFIQGIQPPPDDAMWPGEVQRPRWPDVGKGLQGKPPEQLQPLAGQYQPAEFETLAQPGMGGMTEAQFDRLLPWQKALVWLGGQNPAVQAGGMGAAIGLVSGGPVGALAGAGLGAGMGALVVPEEERAAHPVRAGLSDMLMALDYPAEWFERALGTLELGYGRGVQAWREDGFMSGADAVADVLNNLPAAWKAAHLTYETLPIGQTYQFTSPVATKNTGWDSFNDAYERIRNGERPEDVWNEVASEMGATGQGRELLGHILLDPLNLLGGVGVAAGLLASAKTGNQALRIAARSSSGAMDMLRNYGAILRSTETADDIAKLGPLSRWLGGVTATGQPTDLVQKGGKGVFNYLFSLTPQARATEVVNNSATVTGAVLDRARTANGDFDPAQAAKYLHGIANTPLDTARELSMRALESPDAAAIPLVLKDNVDKIDNIAAAWEASQPRLNVLAKLGELTGRTLEEVVVDLADEAGAKRLLVQIQDLAARSDAPEAKELLLAMQGQQPGIQGLDTLNAKALTELAKPFQGKDGLPQRPEMVKAAMQQAVEDLTAQWAVDWFGVKPDAGWVRTANLVKSAQSLVLLGFNPTYFLNNSINNMITVTAQGLLGTRTPAMIRDIWARAGIQPPRLRAGVGVDAGGLEQAHRIIKEATGTMEDIRRGMDRTRRWQVFGRLSGWNERASSEQAVTSGFVQFMSRNWRKESGFNAMPPALEQRLAAIDPGLPKAIYSIIEGGWSQAEIEKKLWQGLSKRNVLDGVPEIARRTGIPEADVAEVLHTVGAASPEVAEQLAKAADDTEINKILGDIETKAQDHLDDLNAQNLELEAAKAAARVDGEGAQAALELFDQMSYDYSEHWFNHFVHMDTAAQQAELMDGPARSLVWENAFSDARRGWDRLNKRQEAQMAGIAKGLGLDSDTGRRSVGNLNEQHRTWTEFYRNRDEQYRSFRNGDLTWDEVSEKILTAWEEAYTKQETIFDRMDAEYVQLFANQFGVEAGEVARAWRQGIKDIRAKMHTDMEQYRAKGTQSWRQFLRGPYFEGIKALYEHNIEGARAMWKAATGRDATPGPAAPEQPEFVDMDWKLGGSNLAEGRAAQAEPPEAITRVMHQRLKTLGYSDEQMRLMDTGQMWEAINEGADANIKRAAIRQVAAELYPEVLATATLEGQPRFIDPYILNVINKHGGQKYADIADADVDVAVKAISEYKEQQLAKAVQAEEARKAQQTMDLETAMRAAEEEPVVIPEAEPETQMRMLGDIPEEERQAFQAAQEELAKRAAEALADLTKEEPIDTKVRRLYDEGNINDAFTVALEAKKTEVRKILAEVPELTERVNRARRLQDNVLSGNLEAVPDDIRMQITEVLGAMRGELEYAENGTKIFEGGKFIGSTESSYPKWYNDAAGAYKGMPKNKHAVIQALDDIVDGNIAEGKTPAVISRLMGYAVEVLEKKNDTYRKFLGYDIDITLEVRQYQRQARAEYIPSNLDDLISDVGALEARVYDYYGGAENVPELQMEQISHAYDEVLKRMVELDAIENPPKPDPFIEEQAQLMEAGKVAQASWVDDVQQALPAEDRRTNLELRQEIERLQTENQQLRTDPLTGTPVYTLNRETVDAAPYKMVVDLVGLKYMNDTYGEAAGDALIVAAADAAKGLGLDVHRMVMGGDEFVIPFPDEVTARAAQEALQQAMQNETVVFTSNGEVQSLSGFPLHTGVGESINAAYDGVNESKRAAKIARGEIPPGVVAGAETPTVLEQPAKFGKPQQMGMFGAGEDLPLMTGTPMKAQESVFKPAEAARQGTLFDMRPQPKGAIEGGEAAGPLFDAAIQVGQIRDNLRRDFISLFLAGQESVLAGVEDAGRQADAILALLDAHANVWAKRMGKTPLDWYQTHIAGVTKGAPGGEYYQQEAAPVWYSQLERAVESIPQEKMGVDQLRGMIAKGGVKADEIKWTELDDFLAGKKSVTKAEVLEYIRQNKVEVQEVIYPQEAGAMPLERIREIDAQLEAIDVEWQQIFAMEDSQGDMLSRKLREAGLKDEEIEWIDMRWDTGGEDRALQVLGRDVMNEYSYPFRRGEELRAERSILQEERWKYENLAEGHGTKYSTTTLPGGEPRTYKELLLTLPVQQETQRPRMSVQMLPDGTYQVTFEDTGRFVGNPVSASSFTDAVERAWKNYQEDQTFRRKDVYRSPHWQEPNVLAHVRFDDRIDADGKRVLFIEEIQSDWHQAGRKQGYGVLTKEGAEELGYSVYRAKSNLGTEAYFMDGPSRRLGAIGFDTEEAAWKELLHLVNTDTNRVPPAPFAKTWDILTMKRMIRWAAENGYDRIAFPTGPVAARIEGHQLVENISHIRWDPDNPDVIRYKQRGSDAYTSRVVDPSNKLEDYVGADIAKQLREKAAWEKKSAHGGKVVVELDTKDVVFGGETMRWFYDRDLVNNTNKYLKKWGARVGETEIGYSSGKSIPAYNVFDRDGQWRAEVTSLAEAEHLARQYVGSFAPVDIVSASDKVPVHSIDVTPEMKAGVMQGQPLFQGPRGAVSFLEDGRAILHALEAPDVSTLAHEVGHIFRRDLAAEDLAITEKWAGAADGVWNREAEEKFAKGFEAYLKEGKAPVPELQSIFEQFAQWIAHVYARMKEYFTGSEINDDMRGVYNRLLAENPDAQSYNITTQTGRARQATLFQDGSPGVEFEDGRQLPLENNTPDAVKNPLGAVDSMHSEVPLARMEEDGYTQHVQPVLDGLRTHLNDPNTALPQEVTDLKSVLDPDTVRQLRGYLHQVYGQQSDMKLAGVRVAESRRDAALLNYSRRYGLDNVLMATHPYNFWFTRSVLNWALRIIDKPSWLANYYRLRSIGAGMQENEGYPQRLKNKMKIQIPYLPEWAGGGVYVDPMRQMFPFMQMAQPFERLADQNNMISRRAEFVLQDWAEEGEVDEQQISQAMQTKAGPLWDKAIAQAKVEIDEEIENPLDFVNTISGMSLPLNWVYQWVRGKKDRIGPLPTTRMVKGVTAAMGLNQGRGYNMEGPLRRALGMPEYDRFTDYRVDRMLSNMAAEGMIDTQTAQQAMIDRGQAPNPETQQAFIEAERRVAQQGAMGLVGGPFQADLFPEGEQRQRAIKSEYSRAAEAWRAGDEDALSLFFEKYPEYESRLALYKDPDQRLKGYLVGEVWDRYMELPDLHKKQAVEQLGQLFEEAFLDKETRSYDAIKPETLALWAQRLGSDALLSIQGAPQGELELESDELAATYQELQDERDRRWPDIGSKLNLLYRLPYEMQDQYRQMHPEINEYESWRTGYLADHPEIIPYAIGEDNKVQGAKPEIQALYYQYLAGRDRQFPGVMEMQSAYYDNDKPKGFLKQNPMLPAYWEWRREFMKQYPEMIPYIMSTESLTKAVLGEDVSSYAQSYTPTDWVTLTPGELKDYSPALVRQLMAYFYNNETLSTGARKELKRLWEKSGRGLKFEEYLAGPVRSSVVNK